MSAQNIPQTPAVPVKKILIHAVLFLIVFLAGGVAGAVLTQNFGRDEGRGNRPSRDPGGQFERDVASQIAHRYGLAPQDEEKIFAIVKANSEKLRSLHKEFFPKVEACWNEANAKIREILPPEKRAEFDREVQMRQKRMFQAPDRQGRHDDGRRDGKQNPPMPHGAGQPGRPVETGDRQPPLPEQVQELK